MAVSGYLSAELAATCNALGFYDGQKYHLEPHCKETVRDLIRYLRRDEGGSHEIRRYLGNAKLLTTDLLPMVQCHHKDAQLFDIALRLIVNLTNPALLVYNEVVPTDKFEHNYYLEIVSHLQHYKEAFNDHKVWAPFTERLSELLGKNVEDRSEDDQRTVERILILIRNVLHVPSSSDMDQRPDNDASIHDQVLWGLHQSGMIDLLLYISSSDQESLFFMHLLEIICLMLREQPPELLAKTASQRSAEERNKDDEELLKIRQQELQNKMKKNKRFIGTRHSNFGGTFIIKNMKSTSDNNDMIYHKPIHDSKYISLDAEKKPVKLPKNRQPLKCESAERKSALSVRLILKQVCVEFLNAAYNPLMLHVRECFHRGRAQENDESYYFTAMRFFMEFNRHYNFQVKYVSETLSVQTFHFIQKYLETWHEMMTTDKKKLPLWSYRSHLAVRAYKELLHNLASMDRSTDESVRESSNVIKSNIFYVLEYREMLLTLVNLYKREKYSRKYLVDLLETIHIFIKLLCDYCKDKRMVIQKTAIRRKKKNKQKKSKTQVQDQASAETIWNLACDQVALTLTSDIDCVVVPFDATSELDMDQQKLEAIKKIQLHLKNGDNKEAVAMLRASREVWPENDTFGVPSADSTEELEILKEIFLADLGNDTTAAAMTEEQADGSDEEDEEEDHYPQVLEQNFDVIDFLKRFASPKVVKICNILLSSFDTNSETTNHCIVRMLHRIAWECKLPAMLFQASLFIKFRDILSNYEPKYKDLAKLAVYVLRKFTEVAATNRTVFVELLFPKHVKDACEIVDGYGTYQDSKNKRVAWEEHEEDELRRLDEEYTRTNIKENKVDWILDNLINKDRSKKGVMKKMRELGLEIPQAKTKGFWEDEDEDELRKLYEEADKDLPDKLLVSWIHERMTSKEHNERSIKKKMFELGLLQQPLKKLKDWNSEQDEQLTEFFNEHKNSDDIMGPIMAALGSVRSRQNVVGALLRLGLINDKSELRRKSKKPRKSKSNQNDQSDSGSSEDESDESDDESDRRSAKPERSPPLGPSAAAIFREQSKTKYLWGGLKWLIGALSDCLDDLGAEDADVPLLPLSEEPVLSMENPMFHNFLQALGFKKPVPNQEVYWRVAAHWRETEIRTRIDVLNCFVDNAEKELEDVADVLNQKLSTAVGEAVDVLDNSSESVTDGRHPNTENFNTIVERDCQRMNKEKMSAASGSKSRRGNVPEEGNARFDSESDGSSSEESAVRGNENSSDDDAPKSSFKGKTVSRKRFSSESDADDPGSPEQSRSGRDSVNGDRPNKSRRSRGLSSDDEMEVDRSSGQNGGDNRAQSSSARQVESSSDDDAPKSSFRGKTASRRRFSSESDADDPGSPQQSCSGRDPAEVSSDRPNTSRSTAPSSNHEAHVAKSPDRDDGPTKNRTASSGMALNSDSEDDGSPATTSRNGRPLTKRKLSTSSSDSDAQSGLKKKRNVFDSSDEETNDLPGGGSSSNFTSSKANFTPEKSDARRTQDGDPPVKAGHRTFLYSDAEDEPMQTNGREDDRRDTIGRPTGTKKIARIVDSDDD